MVEIDLRLDALEGKMDSILAKTKGDSIGITQF
jgi:hypothetical protein